MSSISGLEFDYNKKNITGIYEITDGGGSTLINGVINCNSLFIDGVELLDHHHPARSRKDRGTRLGRVVQAGVQG